MILRAKSFDDCRFSDAGFAEEDGVVLLTTAEDLDDAFNFGFSSNDRIEFSFFAHLGEIASEGVECGGFALAFFAFGCGSGGVFGLFDAGAEEVEHLFADLFEFEAQVHQDLGGDAVLLTQQAEEQVLGADVIVIQISGFLDGVFDDFFGAGGLGQLAHGDHVGSAFDELFDFEADFSQVDIEVFEHIGTDAGAFLDEAEEDVLGPDIFVVEALGFLVGEGHDLAGSVGKSFKHGGSSPSWVVRPATQQDRPFPSIISPGEDCRWEAAEIRRRRSAKAS